MVVIQVSRQNLEVRTGVHGVCEEWEGEGCVGVKMRLGTGGCVWRGRLGGRGCVCVCVCVCMRTCVCVWSAKGKLHDLNILLQLKTKTCI